jgi:Tetratricopeptide repeat
VGRLQLPQQQATPGQPVRLAPRPQELAGREALLAALDARLAAADGPRPRIVALCGLGGVGKTSAAVEYAYRHLAEVGVAWQFPAGDPAMVAAGFGELAAQLGVRGLADTRDPVASVHAVLAKFEPAWLLIFDNVTDMASVAAFLPPAGPGRVLITSQNPNWPGQALDVPVLDPEVAAGFLVSRTRDPDRQAALDLADVLGGLPLALEQAAAYMVAVGETLAGYLALFRPRRLDLLARGEPTGHPETVTATWALAFERLRRTQPYAIGLLRLMAFCAPEAIPLRLLLQPRPGLAEQFGSEVAPVLVPLMEDSLAAKDAIAALRRYSLVTTAADGSASVHRLVQAVTVDQMPLELTAAWRQATVSLIESALPGDSQHSASWPLYAALMPHAQTALTPGSSSMEKFATYLGQIGNYTAARELQRQVFEFRERVFDPKHPSTLDAYGDLAFWTGEAGDAAAARDQYAALLTVVEPALGPEHADTLTVRNNLARWTGDAGDAAAARDQCAALLPVMEQAMGPEHPHSLAVRANLARWTGDAGDAAAARDHYAALLPIRERVSGHEHPSTLTVRYNLARNSGEAGDAAAARDQYVALLLIHERVLGLEHPDTLIAHGELAHWTGETGDPAAARDQYVALLPVMEQALGPEHPQTLTARNNLANWTGQAGDAAAARDQCAALLPIRERVSGHEHPSTLTVHASLASWIGEAGDAVAARDQCAALLPIRERVLGPEHPDALTARDSLAYWTGEAGNAAAARDQYVALLPIRERVLGPEHPDALTARNNLAHWTGQAGDAAAARDQYVALLPVMEQALGPEHPHTLTARANLAHWTSKADTG